MRRMQATGKTLEERLRLIHERLSRANGAPGWDGSEATLRRALTRARRRHPKHRLKFECFELYWGLRGRKPLTYHRVAFRVGRSPANAAVVVDEAFRLLRDSSLYR